LRCAIRIAADCWGIYGVEVLVLAFGAVGSALSPDIWWLIGLRFILGVGIGGDCPVSATIMSEYAGKASRGMLVTSISHELIWRILVGFGAVPALAVYRARRRLRETPRYLAAAGQEEDHTGS
jgi:MFS family permease